MNFKEFLNEGTDVGKYKLLGRLQADCEYFIKTSPLEKHLWAGNIKDQIKEMKKLFNEIKDKPEWITLEDIDKYEKDMMKKRK